MLLVKLVIGRRTIEHHRGQIRPGSLLRRLTSSFRSFSLCMCVSLRSPASAGAAAAGLPPPNPPNPPPPPTSSATASTVPATHRAHPPAAAISPAAAIARDPKQQRE